MKNYFDKITTKQWRSFLYGIGVLNLGLCLLMKWNIANLVVGISSIAVASTMKDK